MQESLLKIFMTHSSICIIQWWLNYLFGQIGASFVKWEFQVFDSFLKVKIRFTFFTDVGIRRNLTKIVSHRFVIQLCKKSSRTREIRNVESFWVWEISPNLSNSMIEGFAIGDPLTCHAKPSVKAKIKRKSHLW